MSANMGYESPGIAGSGAIATGLAECLATSLAIEPTAAFAVATPAELTTETVRRSTLARALACRSRGNTAAARFGAGAPCKARTPVAAIRLANDRLKSGRAAMSAIAVHSAVDGPGFTADAAGAAGCGRADPQRLR